MGWFDERNFKNCPLRVVEGALRALHESEIDRANLAAIPVSLLGVVLCKIQGERKAKPEWFNPFGELILEREAKERIDGEAARTFMELAREGKIPSWAVSFLDVSMIRLAARR